MLNEWGRLNHSNTMQGRQHLLGLILDGSKAHVRTDGRLADRLGIGEVILVCFDKRFNVLRWDQFNFMA